MNIKKLLYILAFVPFGLFGGTYHVSLTGDNADDGSIGSPWLTMTYATQQLVADDTLYIRGGTYTYKYTANVGVRVNTGAAEWDNGTSGNPIKVMGYPTETVIFDFTDSIDGSGERRGFSVTAEYWEFYDINITGVLQDASNNAFGYNLDNSVGCKLERVNAYENEGYGIREFGSSSDNSIGRLSL